MEVCGFSLWEMMPPCVLPKEHTGDHTDGFGGHYTATGQFMIVGKEIQERGQMSHIKQKIRLVDDLRTVEGDLQRHYAIAKDGWQSSELLFARNVVQNTIRFLQPKQ